jgi:hypothetical protein
VDTYHVWCNLWDSSRDLEFAANVDAWLGLLREEGRVHGHRLARRKLGFGPAGLGEFHLTIEIHDLAQLESAFQAAATRSEPYESRHAAVFSMVRDAVFALERDFPDPGRAPANGPATERG